MKKEIKLFDVVELMDGRRGVVVEVYKEKEKILACEVEFIDKNGKTSRLESIKINDIKRKLNKL